MEIVEILKKIKDDRKYNGKEYQLWQIMLFSIFAILCNAKTYSDIQRFIEGNFEDLKKIFDLKWRRFPTISCIWKIFARTDVSAVEKVFREYFFKNQDGDHICFDGKIMNGSGSRTLNERALAMFNAFSAVSQQVLAHIQGEKDSEHQAMHEFLKKLDLQGVIVTADALHCQKKLSN
jgi:hypothetical protein